jgi:hypothetical protein
MDLPPSPMHQIAIPVWLVLVNAQKKFEQTAVLNMVCKEMADDRGTVS